MSPAPDRPRIRTVDPAGVSIVLSEERWVHISEGHPEVVEIEHELLQAIREPDIRRDGRLADEIWSYRRLPDGSRAPWLKVVVRYGEDGGWVVTAFLRRRMP